MLTTTRATLRLLDVNCNGSIADLLPWRADPRTPLVIRLNIACWQIVLI